MSGDATKLLALIADDYEDGREIVAEILTEAGLQVVAVRDGHSAIAEARQRLPRVVVLDW